MHAKTPSHIGLLISAQKVTEKLTNLVKQVSTGIKFAWHIVD